MLKPTGRPAAGKFVQREYRKGWALWIRTVWNYPE